MNKIIFGMSQLKKNLLGSRGSEIAEAALVMPLMFTILLGIYWAGRAYNVYATLNYAARDAARTGVAPTCATCAQQSAANVATAMTTQVQLDLQAAQIDFTQLRQLSPTPPPPSAAFTTCSPGGTLTSCTSGANGVCIYQGVFIDNTSDPDLQSCGVSVSFYYPYNMALPFTSLNMTQVNISAEAQMAQEN